MVRYRDADNGDRSGALATIAHPTGGVKTACASINNVSSTLCLLKLRLSRRRLSTVTALALLRLAKVIDQLPMARRVFSSMAPTDNLWDRSILKDIPNIRTPRRQPITRTLLLAHSRLRPPLDLRMTPMLRCLLKVKVIVSVTESVPLLMMMTITKTLIPLSLHIQILAPEPTTMMLETMAPVAMITPIQRTLHQRLQLHPPRAISPQVIITPMVLRLRKKMPRRRSILASPRLPPKVSILLVPRQFVTMERLRHQTLQVRLQMAVPCMCKTYSAIKGMINHGWPNNELATIMRCSVSLKARSTEQCPTSQAGHFT